MEDTHHLQRFIEAQAPVYGQVITELRQGCKVSHWMWFIFPQIRGLGHSATADFYAITSRAEAEAYLDHSLLGVRLRECTQIVNSVEGRTAHDIFAHPDDMKFRSCMTLFASVTQHGEVFTTALKKYYAGKLDPLTVERLNE